MPITTATDNPSKRSIINHHLLVMHEKYSTQSGVLCQIQHSALPCAVYWPLNPIPHTVLSAPITVIQHIWVVK